MIHISKRLKMYLIGLLCVLAALVALSVTSFRIAFRCAQKTMSPYSGVTQYVYTDFRLLGYKWGSAWVFHYDSSEMFDAARFTVIVDVRGRLLAVHAPKEGLWDEQKKAWVTVPEHQEHLKGYRPIQ